MGTQLLAAYYVRLIRKVANVGKVDISRSYGVRSLREEDPAKRPPMTADTPMRVASCSKFLTSIMVLQCMEKGLVNLDESLERLLPEVAALKVLTGFDEAGNPIEREPKSPILLKYAPSSDWGVCTTSGSPLITYKSDTCFLTVLACATPC